MAARVLLLIAVTGLFATAWNSDHPDSAAPRLASVPNRSMQVLSSAKAHSNRAIIESVRVIGLTSELDSSGIPLPTAITAGKFRVVDSQGRVGWLTIPASDRSEVAVGEPLSLYLSQSDSERWYFIRVQSAPVIAAPQTGDAIRR
ncbi:MAG: hypothetical protein ACKV2Q_36345 [Planctomycetaceae bacterium]